MARGQIGSMLTSQPESSRDKKAKYRSHGGSGQVHVLATLRGTSVLWRKINYRATWFLWVLLTYPDARGRDVSQTLHLEFIPNTGWPPVHKLIRSTKNPCPNKVTLR